MIEKLVEFGDNKQLVGVITESQNVDPERPAIVFINAGVLHRTGACRASVTLARALAEQGYLCLRFDLYGVGDSGFGGSLADDNDPLQTKAEISVALDLLEQKYGCKRFVLHGLCSGARDAFATAVLDERVIALSMIDTYAYRTKGFYLKKWREFLCQPERWINAIKIRLNRLKNSSQAPTENNQSSPSSELLQTPSWPEYPDKAIVEQAFRALALRRVKLLLTYTSSWLDEFNHPEQFQEMFSKVDFSNTIHMNFAPDADHLMSTPSERSALQKHLLNFLDKLS